MKKILALLIVFISLPFCGWALDVSGLKCTTTPINRAGLGAGTPSPASKCYVNNEGGFIEFVAYFDTGVDTSESVTTWKNFLTTHAKDISRIIVVGAADAERADGNLAANIDLAEKRAKWAVDNVVPDSIKTNCKFNGTETDMCAVYVMGDSDDKAIRDKPADKNAGERSVAIWVIWRTPNCEALKNGKEAIEAALKTCQMDAPQELKGCFDGKSFTPSADEKLQQFWVDMFEKCPALKKVSNDLGISVDLAYNKISAFIASLDRTVWRDEDGNFNTARLASDSIAAVVLGTAGGIITSKLVKKSQIKKGFEDLNCSIGGQRVASYGDEFTVGLQ